MSADNPILNSPYLEPTLHYNTDSEGRLDYTDKREGRRIFKPDAAVIPDKQKGQKEVFEWNDDTAGYGNHLINLCRREIKLWREAGYTGTTRVTKELLNFWFNNPDRLVTKKLFFAQQEAVETAIWLNEAAEKSNAGQNILNIIRNGQKTASNDPKQQLPRIAFKMATGTGKTVVMGCLICYHYFNRQEYRNDTRFADYFLIVAPGITIKDRLGVLFVDTKNKNPLYIEDYYRVRGLVPQNMEHRLENLNARLIITNYHTFEPKILQGNKRSPFDGKSDLEGNKIDTGNKEDFSQVIKRALSKFKSGSRLLILNDEAHHCYLPKQKSKTTEDEEADENARAAVWFSGITEIAKKFKLQSVYDLSATPYYLSGSGYESYSLFPWVVSDFGLIEAIESGLVKIPFLPESDNSQDIKQAILRDIYTHVANDLPRKGQKKKKAEAKEEGTKLKEEPPNLPVIVKGALDQFYNHYKDYDDGLRKSNEEARSLFSAPPVFIIVCNNTSVSKEVYKFIAGYEIPDDTGETRIVDGHYELFSNYEPSAGRLKKRPPTLLIDSNTLEESEQINEDFKKIFASEIEEFKRDYTRVHGQGSTDKISDAQILREVVNTVGKKGKLGAHIRCVVSVSMLTEGWDANTVTHIMGIRKFGSQLLCEQVAGRALRRMNYTLQGYDKNGNVTTDKRKIVIEKFPPEYAHIIGIPFKIFKGGETTTPPPPKDYTRIYALPERAEQHEITFPQVVGYRVENANNELKYDFTNVEDFEIDCSQFPLQTTMGSAFLPKEDTLEIQSVFEKRKQEIIYLITKELIRYHFSDDDRNPQFQYFRKLKEIVDYWYHSKVRLIGESDEKYKKLLYFNEPKIMADHIRRGINPHINTVEYIRPVFNYYNMFDSTKYVNGNTIKEVYPTKKSHVNFVVADTDSWEQIAAKTLEQMTQVESYVKNAFLNFSIPYVKDGKDKKYFPDFIARVKTQSGTVKNLIVEITGMSQEKEEKKWYVENRWLPAVNSMKDKYQYPEWHFIEIAGDIRDIKNQLTIKIDHI
ncbi:MAG: DEAD/DEAH box helicase family protein [Ignavibacteriaceae bacterium]|nr:DEAD/DEAH box helicase family protein [Ignavibacteriaceae bacterium]